ncbi:MAG: cytochrome c biogenesis protein CcdA, partial [Clostridiales bacterium]|nr:cytochrome c biogenesis protein CcdA [Clostridiales bacterium]
MIDRWLGVLGELITAHLWIAPLLAFAAGVLTSFSPCSLSSIPLVIGYVGGYAGGDTKRAFRYSLVFCAGMAVTFTALGTLA